MNPADVQVPKDVKLLCTVVDYCRITDFSEPSDIVNLGWKYHVSYKIATYRGKKRTTRRSFRSKTYADLFVDLLRECTGVEIVGETTVSMNPEIEGKRPVLNNGSLGDALSAIAAAVSIG